MKYFILISLFVTAAYGCSNNPVTGKNSFSLISESQMQTMAESEYTTFLATNRPLNTTDAQMVKRIGSRISKAITQYYTGKGQASVLEGFKWEYNLVEGKTANAWCMPGGKIVVYTGLLPFTQNENALAVVMGHEIAHAVAQHGKQRMTDELLKQLGSVAVAAAVGNKSVETQNAFLTAYDIGSQVGGILPHSRSQELEADKFGLIFAALASYNPTEAVSFWQRMAKASQGQQPLELLSTHPADATRIQKIKDYLPEAMKLYKP